MNKDNKDPSKETSKILEIPDVIIDDNAFRLDKNLTEEEFDELLNSMAAKYKEAEKLLKKAFVSLETKNKAFPLAFSATNDYEKLIIQSSEYKHSTISLNQICSSIQSQIEADEEYFEAQLLLYHSEQILTGELRFDKATDNLRNKYVSSKLGFKILRKTKGDIASMKVNSEKLIRAFESDEYNFRIFLSMKTKLKGL